jgi:hypothetical protein
MGCTLNAPPYYYVSVIPLGIGQIDSKALRVFPTPTSNKLFIEGNDLVQGKFRITDLNGKIVSGRSVQQHKV